MECPGERSPLEEGEVCQDQSPPREAGEGGSFWSWASVVVVLVLVQFWETPEVEKRRLNVCCFAVVQ